MGDVREGAELVAAGEPLQSTYEGTVFFLANGEYGQLMSALAVDLRSTAGFLVADAKGRIVGRVECPMYGTSPETPDALSVRSGLFARRRRLVPAESIEQIDNGTSVIGLRVERGSIKTFL